MAFASIQTAFGAGEISPDLFGRIDLGKWHQGASTMRNFFVNYRGGASSRAGTAYVGTCKQPGTAAPPRDIAFQYSINQGFVLELGDNYMRFKVNGAYIVENSKNITGITQQNPGVLNIPSHGYNVGDWVYILGVNGMTNFNGLTWIVQSVVDANHITLTDLFGVPVNTTLFNTYISGGTSQRLYTISTPYAAVDLGFLKFTQSANTMTLTCVNQNTGTEYPSYELERLTDTNWSLTQTAFASSIGPPTVTGVTAQSSTTVNTWYSYVVTAVDASTGEESIASNAGSVENNDISVYAGSNTVVWHAVAGAGSYNIYRATPSYNQGVQVGSLYYFVGTSLGPSFTDTNIQSDATQVPPTHQNPFARGQIMAINITAQGTGYSQGTVGFTVTSVAGTGLAGVPIVLSGNVVAFLITNAGSGYQPGDTITITDSGGGTGATATMSVGPETGTYPGVVAYYQQRRAYGNSLNNPDTYWMSQIGAFTNMDSSIPTTDTDSIIGTPWSQQIDGIQFMVPMPGGLVILTGKGAWQLNGGNSAALTPADQDANPQAYNGCHNQIQPIVINYDILYVQAKGSIVRDLSYNFFVNIYTGTDLTVLSNHLFTGYQLVQWAYAEEPFKLVWCIRNDGSLLSLTYLKEQDIYAWARHDTNGLYQSVVSVTEPPTAVQPNYIDAVYFIVKRLVQGQWMYYSERLDNRNWIDAESAWCVDCGLSYPMTYPNAILTAGASSGNNVPFTASAGVFSAGNIGNIIRIGGGQAQITSYVSPTQVVANIIRNISYVLPNNPLNVPIPAVANNWSISVPTNQVTGLNHLEGQPVSVLADGAVVQNLVVSNGTINLQTAATSIKIGLGFQAQLQNLYLDSKSRDGSETTQGKRKNVYAVTVRVESTRGLTVGTNQVDASTQPYNAPIPWTNMKEFKERNATIQAGNSIPLFTGDERINLPANWAKPGQVAVQQNYPLPANVLAYIIESQVGDTSG